MRKPTTKKKKEIILPPEGSRWAAYTGTRPVWEWPAGRVHDERTCELCKQLVPDG